MEVKKTGLSVLETIFINILVYIFFFMRQPNQEVYLQLNPHPLFILSMLMGMRYGNYLGVISATISSLFYLKVFISIHGDLTLLFIDFDNYKYLLFFYWSAIILGYFKDDKDNKITKLTNERNLLLDEYRKLSKDYKMSEKIQQDLKKQIIVSDESILNLYEIASKLETLDSEEIYTETIGVLSKYLKAYTISIYSFNSSSGYLRPKVIFGTSTGKLKSINVRDSIGLNKVINEKVAVRWSGIKEDGFPLMSAPIIKNNQVEAVVNIENMDFDVLSEYAFQLFKIIINWVNKALERATFVDNLKEAKYIEGTRLLKSEAFEERLAAEERRKREFGMEYCLLNFKVKTDRITEVEEDIRNLLRSVDVVGYQPENSLISIILPATSPSNKYMISKRIQDVLGNALETEDK